ncbi:hypothetical protein C8A03DRAFT_35612 [Achaetomium macrosporum]|uniref:Arrestin-like N-terminal domain-containing protein n=1 Tax=Achaetomium macrosporum TaxID=79813 RepID=A0AAN7H5W7_9PEZI|nr:hypothetical protein C8A03DRAFT_35612 [Achaetomium macrosporum]
MSIRIILDNPPEFYTNLDTIRGQVVLTLARDEHVGTITVKLEGESRTALGVPPENPGLGIARERRSAGDTVHENHKILYKVAQVFPEENAAAAQPPFVLNRGQHHFPFQFRFPFNNACSNAEAMARIGGVMGAGGIFGMGFRVMDGTKQLMYSHVTKTLPPSFTGFPGEAEIRYYVKVTVQRPGLLRENWRYQMGLKFLPIEPPRPERTNQEAYARRPYAFHPKSPGSALSQKKRSSFFGRYTSGPATPVNGNPNPINGPPSPTGPATPPSVEMSARLPHPAILTCNKPIPLRLIAKKLVPSHAEVYLIAMQIDLIGKTTVRCQNLMNTEISRWVVMARHGLSVLLSRPEDPVGTELIVPDTLWNSYPLPNSVMPTFVTCNLSRDYQLEVKLGLSWGKPSLPTPASTSFLGGRSRPPKQDPSDLPQELHLPLHFSAIQVYSGLAPPPALVEAMRQGRGRRTSTTATRPRPSPQQQQPPPSPSSPLAAAEHAPALPPRPAVHHQQQQQQQSPPAEAEALYPPQLQPDQPHAPYDDAPPTYEEAMAEEMTGPMFPAGAARPAWSGVTDTDGDSSIPVGGSGSGSVPGKS